jgi:hypothetical protein
LVLVTAKPVRRHLVHILIGGHLIWPKIFAQGKCLVPRLSYIEEVTFATTPAGNFTEIPFVTHNLNINKERVTSESIISDRIPRHDRHGNTQVAGEVMVELLAGDYDALP